MAGVEIFSGFGFFPSVDIFSKENPAEYDRILNVEADVIYTKMLINFERSEYEKRLYNIKKAQAEKK